MLLLVGEFNGGAGPVQADHELWLCISPRLPCQGVPCACHCIIISNAADYMYIHLRIEALRSYRNPSRFRTGEKKDCLSGF